MILPSDAYERMCNKKFAGLNFVYDSVFIKGANVLS